MTSPKNHNPSIEVTLILCRTIWIQTGPRVCLSLHPSIQPYLIHSCFYLHASPKGHWSSVPPSLSPISLSDMDTRLPFLSAPSFSIPSPKNTKTSRGSRPRSKIFREHCACRICIRTLCDKMTRLPECHLKTVPSPAFAPALREFTRTTVKKLLMNLRQIANHT